MVHAHCHEHQHSPLPFSRAFLIAMIANGLFVFAQLIFASMAHSTSLLADAVHNLGDVLGLMLAWIAHSLLKRTPTEKTTYGMKKTSILAAFSNGILLVFSCGVIVTEAIYKLLSPTSIDAFSVMVIALIGIIINGTTAMLFSGHNSDLNIRATFMHLLYDAFISLGVLLSAGLIYWTHWLWIDAIMGLLIVTLIMKSSWILFTDSFRLIIDGVPRGISLTDVRHFLQEITGVKEVHDLHIWALSTQENALSVHLWMPEQPLSDEERKHLLAQLKKKHNIHHATIQIERDLLFCEDACVPTL